METKFKEVAHLYLGCDCLIDNQIRKLDTVAHAIGSYEVYCSFCGIGYECSDIKPILRPLSDMTKEEQRQSYVLAGWAPEYYYEILEEPDVKEETNLISLIGRPNVWNYLLSKHFDLFDLIESGEAIDKTKL